MHQYSKRLAGPCPLCEGKAKCLTGHHYCPRCEAKVRAAIRRDNPIGSGDPPDGPPDEECVRVERRF